MVQRFKNEKCRQKKIIAHKNVLNRIKKTGNIDLQLSPP